MNKFRSVATMAGALVIGVAAQASAQIQFVGVTTYAFSTNAATTQAAMAALSYSSTASLLGLTVTADPSTGFNVTTLPITANSGAVSISTSGNSIGKVTLVAGANDYTSQANNFLYIRTIFSPPNSTPTAVYFKTRITGSTTMSTSAVNFAVSGGTGASTRIGAVNGLYDETPYTAAAGSSYSYTINGHEFAFGPTILDGRIEEEHYIPVDTSVTPEPASLILMGTGLLGVVGIARRRRNRA